MVTSGLGGWSGVQRTFLIKRLGLGWLGGFKGLRTSRLLGHRRVGLGGRTAAKGLVQEMAGGEETGRVEKAAGGDSFSAGRCLSPVMSPLPAG